MVVKNYQDSINQIEDPTQWIGEQSYPIGGIISGRGGQTERLSCFVDHFLQPGMKDLLTFR